MKRFFSYLTLAITFAVAGVLPSAAQGYERDVARKTAVPQKGSYLLQVPFEFALQNKSEFEMLTLEASATSGKWFYVGNYKAGYTVAQEIRRGVQGCGQLGFHAGSSVHEGRQQL